MKSSIPWSIKGIEPEAREAAKSAARRSGMTLGQWLNAVILDTDSDNFEEERNYRYPMRNPSPRRESKRAEHDIQDRLDALSEQISGLARHQSETAISRFVRPQVDLEPVTDAVRELVHRVEHSERRSVETLETFDERLSRLSDKFASEYEQRKNRKSQKQDESHEADESQQAFEKALTDIVDHIEETDRRTGESIKAIQTGLEDFKTPAPSAEQEKNARPDREFARIERQLAEMAARLERAESRNADAAKQKAADRRALEAAMEQHQAQQVDTSMFVSRDDLQNIQGRIQEIVSRLDDTSSAVTDSTIVSMQEEISLLSGSLANQKHASASAAEVDALKQAVDNVAAQLQDVASFSGDPEQAIKRIEEEITGLSQSVADLLIETASSRELAALRENYDRIAQQVEAQQALISRTDPEALMQIRTELSAFNDTIAQIRNDAASFGDVEALRDTAASRKDMAALRESLDRIARQVEVQQAVISRTDPEAIMQMRAELSAFNDTIAQIRNDAASFGDIKALRDTTASRKDMAALRDSLESIARQVEVQQAVISRTDPEAIMQMRAELSAFNDTIAQIRNDAASFGDIKALRDTTASRKDMAALRDSLESIARQVEAQQAVISRTDPEALMQMRAELSAFNDTIAEIRIDTASFGDVQALRDTVGHLAAQLAQAGHSDASDAEGMQVLQGEMARLSERLAQIEQAGIPENPDDRAIHTATVDAITTLERGLQSVRENAEHADQRTQETLEAVHETLEKVVLRLARLEDGKTTAPGAPAEAAPLLPDEGMVLETRLPNAPPAPAPDMAPTEVSDPPLAGKPAVNIELPPIVGLEEHTAQPDPEPPISELAPEADDSIPDLRLDPIDIPPEPCAPMPQEPAPKAPAEDFIAAARRATHASGDTAPAGEKPSRSRLDLLGPKMPGEAEKTEKKASRKKTILLAAAVALLAIGALSTISVVKNKRAAPDPDPQSGEVFTAPETSDPAAATPDAAVPSTSNKESKATMPAPQARHIDRPINPQSVPATTANKSDRAMQVYQQIQDARKRSSAATSAPGDPEILGNPGILGDPHVTGSVSDQAIAPDPDAASAIAGTASPNSPLMDGRASAAPETTAAAPWNGGFAGVTESLPPAEIGPMSLRIAAATGNPNAQFEIAARYTEGKIVGQDLRRAATWYQKAAAKDLAPAQYRLGTLYEKGRGVPADTAAARIWYERAAEKGNRKAMHNLAVIYADTNGENHDFAKAAYWFRNAAELGLTDSQYNYGILNERGLGVRANPAEAYKWFAIGAGNGDRESASRVALIEKKLSPDALIRARLEAKNWEPREPVREANMVRVPEGGWGAARTRTDGAENARSSIARAQSLLSEMGYHAGPADGVLGPRTREAIRAFQRDNGLTATGMVSRDLLAQLAAQPG